MNLHNYRGLVGLEDLKTRRCAVHRRHPFTGKRQIMVFNHPYEEICDSMTAWIEGGELIQDAFYQLSADEREFIQTGLDFTKELGDEASKL